MRINITPANRLLAAFGTCLIFLQMILICSDIGGRYLFNNPIPGVLEVVELTIVAIVFLQIPNSVATDALVRSDALFTSLKKSRPGLARVMDVFFSLVGMSVLWIISYGMWEKFLVAVERGYFTGNPGIFTAPTWPTLLCIVVGAAWGGFNFLLHALELTILNNSAVEGEEQ